jgi:hypothetical protein
LNGSNLKYYYGFKKLYTFHSNLLDTTKLLANVIFSFLLLVKSQFILWSPRLLSIIVCIIIIRVWFVNWVLTGSTSIFYFVYYRNEAEFPWNIIIVGLKGFISMSLSIIEKTSYLMKANERRQRSEPYSKDRIVSFLIKSD